MTELVVRPWAGGYALEATLDDGTDRVVLAFVGRREIDGLRIGQELAASGTIGRHRGRRQIMNPSVQLSSCRG